ncbi:cytochrome-c oxidase [Paenibacillus rigui]|uniref:Cytochrome-c oxidase n=1 Tax=Paenibacillus rigui TaxID=554312 RepID=A0A229UUB5_9BACL|nr:cytochrome-c oxidase [Paenibacillus rigui]OXM87008.1 cytochrome-c oxidase [Paenibacillus rigui]
MIIGISQQFQLATVHAHANLLGWVSLALSGIIYHLFPQAGASALGKWHFWLHNIGLPVMLVGLYVEVLELASLPLIQIGGTLAILGIILFMLNVFVHVKADAVSSNRSSERSLDQ